MYLLIGLGNPGDKYKNNRHNIGFMVIDEIAKQYNFPPFKKKYKGLFSDGKIDEQRVLLLKPQTFMNKSGISILEAKQFFKIAEQNIIIFYDELDLAPGRIRIKIGGGSSGHNGIKSVNSYIKNEYKKIRIGIGRPENKQQVTNYVLSDFTKNDKEWIEPVLSVIGDNISLLFAGNDALFMNRASLALFGDSAKND